MAAMIEDALWKELGVKTAGRKEEKSRVNPLEMVLRVQ